MAMHLANHRIRLVVAGSLAAVVLSLIGLTAHAATVRHHSVARRPIQQQSIDWQAVEQALGKSGQMMPGGVYRIAMPRTDLNVTVEGVPVQATFALGSYAAFKPMDDGTMVMGDLVLLDEEVPPV